MIGVISRSEEAWAVEEFFQLFKTPWEFFRSGVMEQEAVQAGGQLFGLLRLHLAHSQGVEIIKAEQQHAVLGLLFEKAADLTGRVFADDPDHAAACCCLLPFHCCLPLLLRLRASEAESRSLITAFLN